MFTPTNEQSVIVLFAQQCIGTDWSIIDIRIQYPDAILQYNGEQWLVEFEYASSNFVDHGHDPRKCDMIVCWEHDYMNCVLPVICLSNDDWKSQAFQKCNPKDLEIEYWKRRSLFFQKKIKANARTEIPQPIPKPAKPKQIRKYGEFPLPTSIMPNQAQRRQLYEIWRKLGSKRQALFAVFGCKNGNVAAWLDMAIQENEKIINLAERRG